MERHLMAVCVFCLLCVDHLPCQEHINNNDVNSLIHHTSTQHQHFNYTRNKPLSAQPHHIVNNNVNHNNDDGKNKKNSRRKNLSNMYDEKSTILLHENINYMMVRDEKEGGELLYTKAFVDKHSDGGGTLVSKKSNNYARNYENTATDKSIYVINNLPNKHNYDNNYKQTNFKSMVSRHDKQLELSNQNLRYKRHANHNHYNDNDISNNEESQLLSSSSSSSSSVKSSRILLNMPRITQEYLRNIFHDYGATNERNITITLENFQRLLRQLGLKDMLFDDNNNNITTTANNNSTSKNNETSIIDNHNNNNNEEDKNTCINDISLLKLVQPKPHIDSQHDGKSDFILNREDVLNICPVLLYQLASPNHETHAGCIKREIVANMHLAENQENVRRVAQNKQTLMIVWVYAFVSVLACSILGLVGVAIIPFMDSRYYHHIIHFLVALAVGTMTGDALLHLLPHSLTNQSEKQMIYKGLVCMSGILFFYITEHGLTMISEWRKNKVKNDVNNTKWQVAKVMRDTTKIDEPTTGATGKSTCSAMGSNGGGGGNVGAGDKVCKSKYSSYPYCYDEIALDMMNDVWLHLPKNAKNNNINAIPSNTVTTTTTSLTTITTTPGETTNGGITGHNNDDQHISMKYERRRNGKKCTNNAHDPLERSLLTKQQQQQNHCPSNHNHNHNHSHENEDIGVETGNEGIDKNHLSNGKKNNCNCHSCDDHSIDVDVDDVDDAGHKDILLPKTLTINLNNERSTNNNQPITTATTTTTISTIAAAAATTTTAATNNSTTNNISQQQQNNRDNEPVTVILREHEATHHGHSHKHGHVHSPPETLSAVAWMIIMGDGLHNFTDGMAIGAAFAENIAGGFSTALAVFCHELPHELGDFAILMKAGMSVKSAVFYNLLTGVLSFIGMIFGIVFGQTQETAQWMFAAAAGLFIYIALVDMMPEISAAHKSIYEFILQILGISSGVALMLLIAIYEGDLMNIFPSQ